jgi:hypothetical protein
MLNDLWNNIVGSSQQAFEQQIADHVLDTHVQRYNAGGPVVNPDGSASATSLRATIAWLDTHITDLMSKTVDTTALNKAVADAVAAHPPVIDVIAVADAVATRLREQFEK